MGRRKKVCEESLLNDNTEEVEREKLQVSFINTFIGEKSLKMFNYI